MISFADYITEQKNQNMEVEKAKQLVKKYNWDLKKIAKEYERSREYEYVDLIADDYLAVEISSSNSGRVSYSLVFNQSDKTVTIEKDSNFGLV